MSPCIPIMEVLPAYCAGEDWKRTPVRKRTGYPAGTSVAFCPELTEEYMRVKVYNAGKAKDLPKWCCPMRRRS